MSNRQGRGELKAINETLLMCINNESVKVLNDQDEKERGEGTTLPSSLRGGEEIRKGDINKDSKIGASNTTHNLVNTNKRDANLKEHQS